MKFKVSLIAYKLAHKIAPGYLIDKVSLFTPNTERSLRPWHGRDAMMFSCNLDQCKNQTWVSKMILEWNDLPVKLRTITNLDSFKKALKTHYFQKAFPETQL